MAVDSINGRRRGKREKSYAFSARREQELQSRRMALSRRSNPQRAEVALRPPLRRPLPPSVRQIRSRAARGPCYRIMKVVPAGGTPARVIGCTTPRSPRPSPTSSRPHQ